jgi:hypothetical protein
VGDEGFRDREEEEEGEECVDAAVVFYDGGEYGDGAVLEDMASYKDGGCE